MDPFRPEETWTPSIPAATDPHLPEWSSFLWHIRYHPTLLTWHIDVKGALAAKRHLAAAYWASSRVRERKYETWKKKKDTAWFVFWTKQYKENITVGQSVSQSVSVWVPTTGGASSPAIMCKSRHGADTLTSISVLWWHAVNENMGRYTGCSEKQHIPPRWRIEADTEMSHTYHPHHTQIHTHMHTHTPTNTTNPIMLSPSPIPLRNERGLCQSNSIVWVEVMNSSLLSIHLRLIVFLFVPVICRW